MRILVTFAVEAEFAPWRRLRDFRRDVQARTPRCVFQTILADTKVDVLLTGIGRAQVEGSLVWDGVLSSRKPDFVISSGFAGALKGAVRPGDLIVPEKVRTLRNDANADADTMLRAQAIQQGATPIQTLITMDSIVSTAVEKERLSFFGEAVDMESALIMSHFASARVPTVAIRAISDAAHEDLPIDFDRCLTPQGAIRPMSLVNAIVKRPGNLPNLVRFGRQSTQAAQRLAAFLDGYVAGLFTIQERVSMA
jgi:adenosylhomocysteine nucleosidase